MAIANIVHSGYGFRCTATEKNLPLTLGLDGSAVLERLNVIPDGWLAEALDQLFVAAPALAGITLPWATWQDEPQAQALFRLASGDYLARETFW
ncbi:acetyltransferase, partial [Escherichia coli]